MIKTSYLLLSFFLLSLSLSTNVNAQVKVTFNVDLRDKIDQGLFLLGQDRIEITGDIYPLTRNRNYQMRDLSPKDSIFTVEITFPRRFLNRDLNYNYVIKRLEGGEIMETELRQIRFVRRELIIAPQLFDGYIQ